MLIHLNTLTGHRAALYALASPGPGRLWSAGGDGWVVEWELAAPDLGRVIASVETQLFSLAVLPGSPTRLVAGNMNGGLHWIDLTDAGATRNVQNHRKGVYDLLPVDPWLYSAGGDGVLTRWSVAEARSVESLQLSHQALRAIAYAPGRGELAIGASDHSICLLDAETLALRRRIEAAHENSVFTVAYSPDERFLLSGGRDAQLCIRDLAADAAVVSRQAAHWFTINHLVYAPGGRQFATASRDKTIKIWDADSFSLIKVLEMQRDFGHVNSVNRLLWNDDGLFSAGDDRLVKWWMLG